MSIPFQLFREMILDNLKSLKSFKVPVYPNLPTTVENYGNIIFNTADNNFYGYNGLIWIPFYDYNPTPGNTLHYWHYIPDSSSTTLCPDPTAPGAVNSSFIAPLNGQGLDDNGSFILFDVSTGAFRAGKCLDGQWTSANRGYASVAFGLNNTASGNHSIINGGEGNTASSDFAIVGGGLNNNASFQSAIMNGSNNIVIGSSFIGTGSNNTCQGLFNVILNGNLCNIFLFSSNYCLIGMGTNNDISNSLYSSVLCGNANIINGYYQTIINGDSNTINLANFGLIGTGEFNFNSGSYSSILTGIQNNMYGFNSFIGTGTQNTCYFDYQTLCTGSNHGITGESSMIGTGVNNSIIGANSGILNGLNNKIFGDFGSIIGGESQQTTNSYAVISSGKNCSAGLLDVIYSGNNNTCDGAIGASVIGSGIGNRCADISVIGSGENNTSIQHSVIGSGFNNGAQDRSVVCGGLNNYAGYGSTVYSGSYHYAEQYSTILDGYVNTAFNFSFIGSGTGNYATNYSGIINGENNSINSNASVIVSGQLNNISNSNYSVIHGGTGNSIISSGIANVIGSGQNNIISGNSECSTILNGTGSRITTGTASLAIGNSAYVEHTHSFVWNGSSTMGTTSSGNNTVTMRAPGGYYFYTQDNLSTGVQLLSGSGAWASVSDRDKKENFQELNYLDILDKIEQLPIFEYNYKSSDKSMKCIGPLAQDWHKLFPSDKNPLYIDTMDLDGIALAAIKALNKILEQQELEINKLYEQI